MFASARWTPARASGGSLWLRADLGVTLATGVSSWADQLGVQSPFVQATGSGQPTMSTSAVNGHPAVVTNGSQHLLLSSFSPPSTDAEIWIVCKAPTSSGAITDVGGDPNMSIYPFAADGKIYERAATTIRKSFAPVVDVTQWHVYSIRSSAGSWTAYQSGVQAFATASNTVGWGASGGAFGLLGRADGTFMAAGDGIAEVWMGRIMSGADRAKARAYIAARYGFTLGGDWI